MEEIISDLYNDTQPVMLTLRRHEVSPQRFYETLKTVPLLAESYARAQDTRADLFAEEIVSIADTEPDHNKARNQMNARIWATSKLKPHVYGERLDINMNTTVDIIGALSEANNRIRDIIMIPKTQLLDTTTTIVYDTTGSKPVETGSTVIIDLDELLD